MKHTFREDNGVVILELNGKIMGEPSDDTLVKLVYDFVEKNKKWVVIDFSNVDWMNSRGLGLCISIATTLRNRDGDLKLACLSEKVESLLNKSRMFAVFEAFKTVEEAIASF